MIGSCCYAAVQIQWKEWNNPDVTTGIIGSCFDSGQPSRKNSMPEPA
jgi:hypothetical protein